MKVHPVPPKKRNIAFRRGAAQSLQKKLRRLPHIFSKVLELPFAADADVAVREDEESFHFVVPAEGFSSNGVRAQAMEICPGVTKVVIREDMEYTGEREYPGELLLDDLEMDRWRFRLPSCTRPELSTAVYAGGELTVTVPKGGLAGEEEASAGNLAGEGISRLIVVQ